MALSLTTVLAPLLTVLFFAFSAIAGRRTTVILDSMWANLWRLGLAAVLLAAVTLVMDPKSFGPEPFFWFFLSGMIGFGLGDIGLFLAYVRLGSRLTILINLCLAPVFATAGEWLWLDTPPTWRKTMAIALILVGVGLAVLSKSGPEDRKPELRASGLFWAMVAGFGQGVGALISRIAEARGLEQGVAVGAVSQAFQRCLGGLVVVIVVTALAFQFKRKRGLNPGIVWDRRVVPWLIAAALAGPVIGVSCFQWSLTEIGDSARVLAITATTPIVLIPLAWIYEKDRPNLLAVAGAVVAVLGVMANYLWVDV
ncbi:MAG: DMT family transporter [Verrucomicrobiota bacterium]